MPITTIRHRESSELCTEAEDILQDTFSAVEKCLAGSGAATLRFVVQWEDAARTEIRERIVQRLHDVHERGVGDGANLGAVREQRFRSIVALMAVKSRSAGE